MNGVGRPGMRTSRTASVGEADRPVTRSSRHSVTPCDQTREAAASRIASRNAARSDEACPDTSGRVAVCHRQGNRSVSSPVHALCLVTSGRWMWRGGYRGTAAVGKGRSERRGSLRSAASSGSSSNAVKRATTCRRRSSPRHSGDSRGCRAQLVPIRSLGCSGLVTLRRRRARLPCDV